MRIACKFTFFYDNKQASKVIALFHARKTTWTDDH